MRMSPRTTSNSTMDLDKVAHSDCFASFGRSHRRVTCSQASGSTHSTSATYCPKTRASSSITTGITTLSNTGFRELDRKSGQIPVSLQALGSHVPLIGAEVAGVKQLSGTTYQQRQIRPWLSDSTSPVYTSSEPVLELETAPLKDLRAYMSQTKHLLSSCCLLDMRLPTCYVVAATDDRISRHVDVNFSSPEIGENAKAYFLQTVLNPHRRMFLIVKRQVERRSSREFAFTMMARVDVTRLLGRPGFTEQIDDIWLNLAADEMRCALLEKPHLRNHIPETQFLHMPPSLISSIQQIIGFYDSFFIIEPSSCPGSYEVTHVSAENSPDKTGHLVRICSGINKGHYKLARLLAQGYRFLFDARTEIEGPHEIVWCLPLAGVGLKCWICFLLDNVA